MHVKPRTRPDDAGPPGKGRDRSAWAIAAGVLAVLLALLGCDRPGQRDDDQAALPEGYRLVVHPDAAVALPANWTVVDTTPWAEVDAAAVELRPPGAPASLELGAVLWRYGESVPAEFIQAPSLSLSSELQLLGLPGFARVRQEPLEVAGAPAGYLLQTRFEAPVLAGAEIRATYLTAALPHHRAVVLRLLGGEEDIPPEVVDVAAATLRVTTTEPER